MNKKISELTKATEVKNEDIMMILQDNENKQVEVKNIFNHRYKLEVTENSELGQEIDIPCYYKVGKEVLDVYLNGERLLKKALSEVMISPHICTASFLTDLLSCKSSMRR